MLSSVMTSSEVLRPASWALARAAPRFRASCQLVEASRGNRGEQISALDRASSISLPSPGRWPPEVEEGAAGAGGLGHESVQEVAWAGPEESGVDLVFVAVGEDAFAEGVISTGRRRRGKVAPGGRDRRGHCKAHPGARVWLWMLASFSTAGKTSIVLTSSISCRRQGRRQRRPWLGRRG
jgi:hypothetical protein